MSHFECIIIVCYRYMSVIPNEATRVRLPSDDPSNDNLAGYINANYIRVRSIINRISKCIEFVSF